MSYPASGKVRFKVLLLLIVVVIALAWIVVRRADFSESQIRNVILISIDTCRADHLSCYGYTHTTTPNIDKLASEGVLFLNVISPVPITLPSHASMLTGTVPPYHGIHDNVDYKLGESNVTLAEILKKSGFTTGAVVSSVVLDSQLGLDQGFDTYNDHIENRPEVNVADQREGGETTRLALDWLEENQNERFFFFLHYYDPHTAYNPPEPFASKYAFSLYAGEIAYTDHCIGQVISKLKDLGLYDSTLIIITSDHGEMLGEHGELTHGYFVYQGNLKVPLIFRMPGQRKAKRIKDIVGLIDIVPTVCSLLDIKTPSSVQGRDLSGGFEAKGLSMGKRFMYCESLVPTIYNANSLLGIVTDRFKYIQTTRPELYDIIKDPAESNNLFSSNPKQAHLLKGHLELILKEQLRKSDGDGRLNMDEQALEKLQGLGYVVGNISEEFDFDQTKVDPKDLIEFHSSYMLAIAFMREGKLRKSELLYKKLLSQKKDYYRVYYDLGLLSLKQGNFSMAIKYFQETLKLKPGCAKAYNSLGLTYSKMDKLELAIANYKKTLEYEPDSFEAIFNLGLAYQSKQSFARAIKFYRKAITIKPRFSKVQLWLGATLREQGKITEAIEVWENILAIEPQYSPAREKLVLARQEKLQLEKSASLLARAIAENPDNSELHVNLGEVYFKLDLLEKTIYHWQMALQLQPEAPGVMNNLAYLLATQRDEKFFNPSKAIDLAERACELTENKDARYLDTLATAYGASERFPEAIDTAQKAIKAAQLENQPMLADDIQSRLELYQAGKAYR